MKTKQEIKETREYIKNTVQFKIKVAKANEWFDRNFKLSDDADEGRHICERYCAEIQALHELYHYEKCLWT
jgi:hypothetical protein